MPPYSPTLTTALLTTEQGRTSIREFLSAADISIADVQAISRKGMQAQWVMSASGVQQASQEEREFLLPVFEHTTPKGSAKFELHDESEGTQRLHGLIAPVLDCPRDGARLGGG